MEYTYKAGSIRVPDTVGLSLKDTLECGQCFRFQRLGNEDYLVAAMGRALRLQRKDGAVIFHDTAPKDFENIWVPYFDFERDYQAIKNTLAETGGHIENAIRHAPGIKILRQDFFECLISFIMSQNKKIPMIKEALGNISAAFGRPLGEYSGNTVYSFPSPEALINAGEAGLRDCKAGFRAKYMIDAAEKIHSGAISPEKLMEMDTLSARAALMEIRGVGPKVADCVLLFSLGRHEVFPTDVWVKRIMSDLYFQKADVPLKDIQGCAETHFGSLAGFAQQYLFNYARDFRIGTKS